MSFVRGDVGAMNVEELETAFSQSKIVTFILFRHKCNESDGG